MAKTALTDEQKDTAFELKEKGYSQTNIAALMDVSQGTISRAIKNKEDEIKYQNLEEEKAKLVQEKEDMAKEIAARAIAVTAIMREEKNEEIQASLEQKQIEYTPVFFRED